MGKKYTVREAFAKDIIFKYKRRIYQSRYVQQYIEDGVSGQPIAWVHDKENDPRHDFTGDYLNEIVEEVETLEDCINVLEKPFK